MNLALSSVWEDARVGDYWSHSFDTHLSYQGPILFSILNPAREESGVATAADGLMAIPPFADTAGVIL